MAHFGSFFRGLNTISLQSAVGIVVVEYEGDFHTFLLIDLRSASTRKATHIHIMRIADLNASNDEGTVDGKELAVSSNSVRSDVS